MSLVGWSHHKSSLTGGRHILLLRVGGYLDIPCPVLQSTPKGKYIFLDISLNIPLYGFCLLWCSGYLQTLLGRSPKPNSFLCSGQTVRSSLHSSNNPTQAKHNLPSSSTPSREALKQPYKCSFVLLEQFFTIKIDLALLFRAERLNSFLECCWKEQTHLKSPIFTKCLLVWLCMESVGNVGVCACQAIRSALYQSNAVGKQK